jgi:hypothetical protein
VLSPQAGVLSFAWSVNRLTAVALAVGPEDLASLPVAPVGVPMALASRVGEQVGVPRGLVFLEGGLEGVQKDLV